MASEFSGLRLAEEGSEAGEEYHVSLMGAGASSKQAQTRGFMESSSLMTRRARKDGSQLLKLNAKSFKATTELLKMPSSNPPPPRPPASPHSGEICGWLMYQGKSHGAWKQCWFVLASPYLYKYKSDAAGGRPKAAFYVTYAMPDRLTADELAAEAADLAHVNEVESRACSLRITVYTPNR